MSQPKPGLNYNAIQNAPTMWRSGFKQQFRTINGKGQEQTNISPEQLPDFASEQLQDWQKQQPPVKPPTTAVPTEVPIVPMHKPDTTPPPTGPIFPSAGPIFPSAMSIFPSSGPRYPSAIPLDESLFGTPQTSPRIAPIEPSGSIFPSSRSQFVTAGPFNYPPPPSSTASTLSFNPSLPPSMPSSAAPSAPPSPLSNLFVAGNNLVDLAPKDLVLPNVSNLVTVGNLSVQ